MTTKRRNRGILMPLKRPIIGGLLSALAAGIPMTVNYFFDLQSTSLILSIFIKSFTLPGLILSLPLQYLYRPSDTSFFFILLSLFYWFLFGFGLSLIVHNKWKAIAWWLFFVSLSSVMITGLLYPLAHALN